MPYNLQFEQQISALLSNGVLECLFDHVQRGSIEHYVLEKMAYPSNMNVKMVYNQECLYVKYFKFSLIFLSLKKYL